MHFILYLHIFHSERILLNTTATSIFEKKSEKEVPLRTPQTAGRHGKHRPTPTLTLTLTSSIARIQWKKCRLYPVFSTKILSKLNEYNAKVCQRNWVFATKSNFLKQISLKPENVNLWYFKLRSFDLTKSIVWNI